MNIDEFRAIDQEARLSKPKLFSLATPDALASVEALDNLQRAIGVILPISYRGFLNEFGGGNFGLVTVFSADPNSEWFLPNKYDEARRYVEKRIHPVKATG